MAPSDLNDGLVLLLVFLIVFIITWFSRDDVSGRL